MNPRNPKGDADDSDDVARIRRMIAEGAAQADAGLFVAGEQALAETRRRREEHRRRAAATTARTLPP